MGNRPQPAVRFTPGPSAVATLRAATPDERITIRVWLYEAAARTETQMVNDLMVDALRRVAAKHGVVLPLGSRAGTFVKLR